MPTPFRFSMQNILDYRSQMEEQARINLARAENDYQNQNAILEDLNSRLQQIEQHFLQQDSISPNELWLWRNYKERILLDMETAREKLKELSEEVKEKRSQLLERSKEKKKIEKIKSKRALEHYKEQARKEQNELDEIGTLHYQKRTL